MSLAPKNEPVEPSAAVGDQRPKVVGTPEGDNEFPPDAPLKPTSDGLETPAGNAPSPYDADPGAHKPTGIEKFIDEVARGEYM